MARVTPLYNSFVGGELSPRLEGRADLKMYYSGCRTLENFGVWAQGGAYKRPGTRYISTAGDIDNRVKLVDFVYSEDTAYIIEFGNQYARFYIDDGQIVNSGTLTPYEIVTPYTSDMLQYIKFVQNADVMYITHPSIHPQKLVRYGHDNWTIEDVPFVNGPFLDDNTDETWTLTPSATTGDIDVTANVATFSSTHVGSYWKISGIEEIEKDITGANQWSDPMELDKSETIFVSTKGTWIATVTVQVSYDLGVSWQTYTTFVSDTSFNITSTRDDVYYRIGVASGDFTSGTVKTKLMQLDAFGYFEVTHYTSDTVVSGTVIRDLPGSDATFRWSEGAFSEYNGYPACVAFFEERCDYAATPYKPQTLWASKVGDYEDFKIGTNDNDAYIYTLASNSINEIISMIDSTILHVLTTGGEWRFGNAQTETTPTFVNVRRESTYGSYNVQAMPVSHILLFIQKGGQKLRQRYYSYEPETWISPDISPMAEHLFESPIIDMAYTAQPEPTLWMVREDGDMVGMTFSIDATQTITAFHHHTTDGEFESIAVIPGPDRDELWACVKRTTQSGTTTRFIEQFQSTTWTNQDDAWYVDCGLEYEGVPTDAVTGMDHLPGIEVSVMVSGAVHPNVTTSSSGSLALDYESGHIIAGLPFTATLKTMSVEAGTQTGTAQSKKKNISKVVVRLNNTLGCKIGYSAGNTDIIPFRSSADLMDQAPALFTGDKTQRFNKGWDGDLSVTVVSDQPTPINILAVIPTIKTSEH